MPQHAFLKTQCSSRALMEGCLAPSPSKGLPFYLKKIVYRHIKIYKISYYIVHIIKVFLIVDFLFAWFVIIMEIIYSNNY